eukprot:gene3124-5294_t
MTYNIHEWKTKDFYPSIKKLTEFLADFDLDFLGLQEVLDGEELYYLAKHLKMNFFFHPVYEGYFGNAIFSKYKITETIQKELKIEQVETRGFMVVKFDDLHLGVTHLDVELEEHRIEQYNQIKNELELNSCNILFGDFNALRIDDYSKTEWKKIEKVRRDGFWEKPKTKLIHLIEEDFVDIWSQFEKVTPTCRYNTRIDYIFVNKTSLKDIKVKSIEKIDEDEISDHNPILMKFLFQN